MAAWQDRQRYGLKCVQSLVVFAFKDCWEHQTLQANLIGKENLQFTLWFFSLEFPLVDSTVYVLNLNHKVVRLGSSNWDSKVSLTDRVHKVLNKLECLWIKCLFWPLRAVGLQASAWSRKWQTKLLSWGNWHWRSPVSTMGGSQS